MDLLPSVRRTIRGLDLFPRDARVLVALSGGPDSVALLHVLRRLAAAGDLTLAGVGHFNHGLRGAEADGDEAFCREAADAAALPMAVGRADTAAIARRDKRSVEDAARRLRYDFLARAADELGADVIATGHTRDDQAETFLGGSAASARGPDGSSALCWRSAATS
jgi:tRNA(Ile)-lysidine synthase